mmetsp:Transcript_3441/g.13653  ORF Transcript_3441/g.13653 Transcript_3441/m.13653 type:complete len:242 (+) Transcript_3441:824-1549(+)
MGRHRLPPGFWTCGLPGRAVHCRSRRQDWCVAQADDSESRRSHLDHGGRRGSLGRVRRHHRRPWLRHRAGELRRVLRSSQRAADLQLRQDHPWAHDARQGSARQGADHRRRHRQLHRRREHLQGHHFRAQGLPGGAPRREREHLGPPRRSQLPGGPSPDARGRPADQRPHACLRPRDAHRGHRSRGAGRQGRLVPAGVRPGGRGNQTAALALVLQHHPGGGAGAARRAGCQRRRRQRGRTA